MGIETAILGSAVIGGGMSYLGASQSADAAESAADTQAAASDRASQVQWNMFSQNRADMMPWLTAGREALGNLSSLTAPGGQLYNTNFTAADFNKNVDPGYQWRLNQGEEAVKAAAGAQGMYGSGNMATALTDYGQGAASQEYQNAYNRFMNSGNTLYNRLAGISGTGQTQSQNLATLGSNTASSVGQLGMAGANAQAAGQNNAASAWASGYQGISNQLMGGAGTYLNQNNQNNLLNALTGQNSSWNLANTGYGQSVNNASNYYAANPNAYYAAYGGYAEGGRPPVGLPSIVGEQGPETFVPDQPGTIIPNPQTTANMFKDFNPSSQMGGMKKPVVQSKKIGGGDGGNKGTVINIFMTPPPHRRFNLDDGQGG